MSLLSLHSVDDLLRGVVEIVGRQNIGAGLVDDLLAFFDIVTWACNSLNLCG
jgi:hypothetical protein